MLDEATSSALVAEHGRWLMAFLRGLTDSAADAEDAFQETWLRLFRSKAGFRAEGVRSYLVKTARSVVIDRLRKKDPAASLDAMREDADGAVDDLEPVDGTPTPDRRYESKATAADVRAAVASLPFNWRQVVLMRIEGELEFSEIASELGVPLGTALTWMHRATNELKRKLGGEK